MPELPDLTTYVEALQRRIVDREIESFELRSPFVLRTFDPPYSEVVGKTVQDVQRLAKRIVLHLSDELWIAVHLMKLGRFRWAEPAGKAKHASGKALLATLRLPSGVLHLTETGTKKRAAIHIGRGADALAALDPGGLEVFEEDYEAFAAALRHRNHTLKRALTDPRILAGIGNAYSDEILWQACLSPVKLTGKLDDDEMYRLYEATLTTLQEWTERLRAQTGDGFPDKVTAFREEMAVHGRYGKPCPRCGAPVQRIVYAERETNYCAACQSGGRPLADRGLSRLLGKDWPKTLEELEDLRGGKR